MKLDNYYQTYRLLSAYVAFLDQVELLEAGTSR
jgi:hypothetical protein